MRAIAIAISILGSMAAAVFAYANIGMFLSGSAAQMILMPLAAMLGALPGLILLRLVPPGRRDRD